MTRNRLAATTAMLVLVGAAGLLLADGADQPQPPVSADRDGFRTVVAPFLQQHCVKCHGPDKQKGKLSLHAIGDLVNGKDLERWKLVAERLALAEMPPESEPRPDAQATARVLAWIKSELGKAGESTGDAERKLLLPGHGNRIDHAALFSGKITAPSASPARLWRMSPQSYMGFIPRITGSKPQTKGKATLAQPFSTSSAEGFKDFAGLFAVDEPTVSQLLRNARKMVEGQTARAGAVKEFAPLFDPSRAPTDAEVAAAVRKQFQLALFREPTAEETQRFVALARKSMKDAGQEVGAKTVLAAVLLLPEALYRVELGSGKPDEQGRRMLAPRELAYAIGFALTDEGPDAALLRAADTGKLATKEDVRREVQRLLDDKNMEKPRILRFFEEYFEYPAAIEVFKDLKRGMWRPEILVNDTRLLIQYILDRDRDVLKELLTTNKSFVNYKVGPDGPSPGRAAKPGKPGAPAQLDYNTLYGVPADWKWTPQQPIELPKEQRAGILTQPSWLAAYATNNETHAIRRGKWVRERLLGGVVPDLPIGVDAQLPDKPDQTIRQRMEITRAEYCWQCHQKMNDLGLAFEMYDYLGRSRQTEEVVDLKATAAQKRSPAQIKAGEAPPPIPKEVPLDTTGLVAHSGDPKLDGDVKNAIELLHQLARSERVRQVFVRHAFRYWLGRNETLSDAPTLLAADRAYVESNGSMKALIAALLTSDAFLYRYQVNHRDTETQRRE